jgi:hypothetical protein
MKPWPKVSLQWAEMNGSRPNQLAEDTMPALIEKLSGEDGMTVERCAARKRRDEFSNWSCASCPDGVWLCGV